MFQFGIYDLVIPYNITAMNSKFVKQSIPI